MYNLLYILFLYLVVLLIFFFETLGQGIGWLVVLLVLMAFGLGPFFKPQARVVDLSAAIVFVFVIFIPAASMSISISHEYLYILALYYAALLFFLFMVTLLRIDASACCSRGESAFYMYKSPEKITKLKLLWFVLLIVSIFFMISSPQGVLRQILFPILYSSLLIIFEIDLRRCGAKFRQTIFYVAGYVAFFVVYISLYWSGYGRLYLGALIVAPIFIFILNSDRFPLKGAHIVIAGPLLIMLAHISRYGSAQINQLHSGSIGSHLELTKKLFSSYDSGYFAPLGLAEYLNQLVLFFLQWFPRELWENKPVGVGLTSVDVLFGREGVSENHSIALGLVGESFYYLGYFFPLGVLFALSVVAITIKGVSKISNGFDSPVVIFYAFLSTLFWGGLASYSSRVWLFVIPLLILSFLANKIHFIRPAS